MDYAKFAELAINGPNAIVFTALNVLALFAMRVAGLSQVRVLTVVAICGAIVGAANGLIVGLATEGISVPVLYYNTFIGAPVGAALALVGAALISKVPEYLDLWPVSPEKKQAEAIRDPMNPAAPPATSTKP